MISLNFAERVRSTHIYFHTLYEEWHCLLEVFAEHDDRAQVLVIDQVGQSHQKVAIANSVLDTNLSHRLTMLHAHNIGVRHVDFIESPQDVAGSLP